MFWHFFRALFRVLLFELFFHGTAPLQITATDRSVAAGGDINGPVNIGSDETTTRRTIAEGLRPLEERLTSIEGLLARWDERRSGNSPTQASAKENTNKNPIEAVPLFHSSEINLASLNSSVLPINGITGSVALTQPIKFDAVSLTNTILGSNGPTASETAPLFHSSEINLASLNSSVLPINGITGSVALTQPINVASFVNAPLGLNAITAPDADLLQNSAFGPNVK